MGFNKRTYQSLKEFLTDMYFPLRHRKRLRETREKGVLTPDFQERLMLAAISVYGCRYCSYLHTKLALQNGISREEARMLLAGVADGCPEAEVPAMFYAQHWAESDAHPDAEAVGKLREIYGAETAEAINLMLRMIRLGSLTGNTFDYFLYRISFGRWRRPDSGDR